MFVTHPFWALPLLTNLPIVLALLVTRFFGALPLLTKFELLPFALRQFVLLIKVQKRVGLGDLFEEKSFMCTHPCREELAHMVVVKCLETLPSSS